GVMTRNVTVLAAACLVLLGARALAQDADGPNGKVAQAVTKLGGNVQVDAASPDKPIVGVRLGNKAADPDLAQLKDLPKLRVLSLNAAKVTDKGLESVKDLPAVEELDLGFTQITDAGMDSLGKMTRLRSLSLPSSISDAGVAKLKGLTELRSLSLSTGSGDTA